MLDVVGFYTKNTPYEAEAMAMKFSADPLGMNVHLYGLPSRGRWEANCQLKAEVLLTMASEMKKPFLYVDADARFFRYPELFDCQIACEYDLAFHYFRSTELLSGTIWVNPTVETMGTLQEWAELNRELPNEWDQRTLHKVVNQSPKLRILRLPAEYCYIYDLSAKHYPAVKDPIIVHYQASRKYKQDIKRGGLNANAK